MFLLDLFLRSSWVLEAGFSVPWATHLGGLVWALCAFILGGTLALYKIRKLKHNVRAGWERFIKIFLVLASICTITFTFGVVLSLLFETIRFFFNPSQLWSFFFRCQLEPTDIDPRRPNRFFWRVWGSPTVYRNTSRFGNSHFLLRPPIGLLTAVYLNEYASSRLRSIVKPLLEVLAGIPTVVYGFFLPRWWSHQCCVISFYFST